MTKSEIMTKFKTQKAVFKGPSSLGFDHSFVIRHLDFDI